MAAMDDDMWGGEVLVVELMRFRSRWQGFQTMGRQFLSNKKASDGPLIFEKWMGVGSGNGFSLWPDFSSYIRLTYWTSKQAYENNPEEASHRTRLQSDLISKKTYLLKPLHAHGAWGGANPFGTAQRMCTPGASVAVITRATIRWSQMIRFWSKVPQVSRALASLERPPQLAIGIGEMPFRYQATFSVWNQLEDVMTYAYKQANHTKMIHETKETGWYSEEMFARFEVLEQRDWAY